MGDYRSPMTYELAKWRVWLGQWTVDADAGLIYGEKGQLLRGKRNTSGYVQHSFRWNGVHVAPLAHIVIWETVKGPKPSDMTLNHINGVKDDNRIANLELATVAVNLRHAFATGLKVGAQGTDIGTSKLTEQDVRDIRALLGSGHSNSAVARMYHVVPETIRNIKRGKTWGCVA